MQYTDFKGKKISRLGFGAMRLPMDSEGNIIAEKVQEMVDYAMANGITYYDTAYKYHGGESEIYFGKALSKHPRESFYLADKMPTWLCSSEEDVNNIFQDQLEKCGTEYFDFYLVHSVDEDEWPNIQNLKVVENLLQKKEAGLIHHLGASFHCSPKLLREILTVYGDALEFVQLQINYMDWANEDAEEVYKVALEFNKPIIVMEPLRGGYLAKPLAQKACDILDAAGTGASYPSFGFRFVNELPGIMTTLSGMSALDQMVENIKIFEETPLTEEERKAIDGAVAALNEFLFIPCTGCNYCYECPMEIRISEVFKTYNNAAAKGFHHIWGSLSGMYNKIQPNAAACIGCGHCESVCPQNIKIADKMKEIHAKYEHLASIGE